VGGGGGGGGPPPWLSSARYQELEVVISPKSTFADSFLVQVSRHDGLVIKGNGCPKWGFRASFKGFRR
jgi:hypothetical protein